MKLLLLPNLLGEHRHHEIFLPASVDKAVAALDGLISESESGGRRYLSHFKMDKRPHDVPLALFNKNTPDDEIDFLLEPIRKGERWGYVSDAGLPCIADPGAKLVARAYQLGLQVQAFIGPSAITLALMLSGLSGQHFCFHGYPPREERERNEKFSLLGKQAGTQIFIQAPHRNEATLKSLIDSLDERVLLSVAWDLTLPTQGVMTHPVERWKKMQCPNLQKRCALFLFGL
jgi:16S rRNA (cytidine1402-2'-O)-methyltransferase